MYLPAHAAIPIVVACLVNHGALKHYRRLVLSGWELLAIGLAGTLPDLLNPHRWLYERFTSWSHTAWALAGLAFLVLVAYRLRLIRNAWLAHGLVFAYLAHLWCDATTGGIAPFYPTTQLVVGRTLVHSDYWVLLDLSCSAVAIGYFVCLRTMANRCKQV